MDRPTALQSVRSRVFQRIAIVVGVFILSLTFTLALLRYTPENHIRRITTAVGNKFGSKSSSSSASDCARNAASADIWRESQRKFENLRDDKFSYVLFLSYVLRLPTNETRIAMQTYRRPKELNQTLFHLLEEEGTIPSLLEVVVVWNDLENSPPPDYKSRHGVPVRYRHSQVNSLNQKLLPDPAYQTQAIFLSDDDIFYKPADLEFVFQTWREFGRDRMTGGFARCAVPDGTTGKLKYSFCSQSKDANNYNLILSGLAFAHISFLDYYSSTDPLTTRIREYVDEHFNCEDLAMNFVTSMLTGEGPLLVEGHEAYVSYVPEGGISTKPGHLEARNKCLNDYVDMFNCNPLVTQVGHIKPGVVIA